MIEVIPFASLGRFDNDWLSARYHFSFAGYHDPSRRGVGPLLVWNDDTIQPGGGFEPHGHQDMEIITYVRQGAITHKDLLGNQGRTVAGDVQVMSAGSGIRHAEYNLEDEPTLIYQIWIEPAKLGVAPRWATRSFPKAARAGQLVPLASGRPGHEEALPIHQDAAVLGATLGAGESISHALGPARRGYLALSKGKLRLNGEPLSARDGALVKSEAGLTIEALEDSELLLADLPYTLGG